jgi:hypothetical protein
MPDRLLCFFWVNVIASKHLMQFLLTWPLIPLHNSTNMKFLFILCHITFSYVNTHNVKECGCYNMSQKPHYVLYLSCAYGIAFCSPKVALAAYTHTPFTNLSNIAISCAHTHNVMQYLYSLFTELSAHIIKYR